MASDLIAHLPIPGGYGKGDLQRRQDNPKPTQTDSSSNRSSAASDTTLAKALVPSLYHPHLFLPLPASVRPASGVAAGYGPPARSRQATFLHQGRPITYTVTG